MKLTNLKKIAIMILTLFMLTITATSCSKNSDAPYQGPVNGNPGGGTNHIVDQKLVGTWVWSEAGDGNWYDPNGVYTGPSYGLALEYKINADGSGAAYNHYQSSIGAGTDIEVNIASTGFFESDNEQHFGYFPLQGTYESIGALGGEDRSLEGPNELFDPASGTGKSFLYQKLEFKTTNGRQCFEVTSSDNITDRYWKVE